jgi:hypothetical protein
MAFCSLEVSLQAKTLDGAVVKLDIIENCPKNAPMEA